MTTTLPTLVSATLLAVGLLLSPMAASAGAGAEFGHHVRSCAQTTGFDGTHNPGMHTGYVGWDPTHAC